MIRGRPAEAFAALLLAACAPTELPPERPQAETAAERAPHRERAPPQGPIHAAQSSPHGSHYRLQDLIGRKLGELDRATCANAAGWRLVRGLMVEERPLAVRSCARFRGPHDVLEKGGEAGSKLTLISDGGRIVFAVATQEYDLDQARRVADALMSGLVRGGCEQVHSTELAAGFSRCPGAATWAAVSRVELRGDGGSLHAVVLEVAVDRTTAGRIASAYAGLGP
jgi:hypothetical protein